MLRPIFQNRVVAGRQLAGRLADLAQTPSLVVLGLPRGGIPVAKEVANALHAPLDFYVVRKMGVPGHEEVALGAIASGGVRVLNQDIIDALSISPEVIDDIARRESRELERRDRAYRVGPAPVIRDATVILVDDGIATGATMQAAVNAVRKLGARRVIVAAPVMSVEAYRMFSSYADRCECLVAPQPFDSVGLHYADFKQLTDADVRLLLSSAQRGAVQEALPQARQQVNDELTV